MNLISKPAVVLTRKENFQFSASEKYPHINWIEFPLIKFEYQDITKNQINEINSDFDWLVFTSQNAVKAFFQQAKTNTGISIACVGPKTAKLVESYGYRVNFIPETYTSISLANEIPAVKTQNICYVGGNLSNLDSLQVLKNKSKEFLR